VQGQHREVRRRSESGDDLRRIRWRHVGQHAGRVAGSQGAVPSGDFAERAAISAHPGCGTIAGATSPPLNEAERIGQLFFKRLAAPDLASARRAACGTNSGCDWTRTAGRLLAGIRRRRSAKATNTSSIRRSASTTRRCSSIEAQTRGITVCGRDDDAGGAGGDDSHGIWRAALRFLLRLPARQTRKPRRACGNLPARHHIWMAGVGLGAAAIKAGSRQAVLSTTSTIGLHSRRMARVTPRRSVRVPHARQVQPSGRACRRTPARRSAQMSELMRQLLGELREDRRPQRGPDCHRGRRSPRVPRPCCTSMRCRARDRRRT
jgi:hypothetical protein